MMSWKRTSPGSDLQDEQVHLWRVDLDVPDAKFGISAEPSPKRKFFVPSAFAFRNCSADLRRAGERCG